jgi:predicted nucleic acid-binding protein
LAELRAVLHRDKSAVPLKQRGLSVADLFDRYAALAEIVRPVPLPTTILRDPDDDIVLATALAARADAIV